MSRDRNIQFGPLRVILLVVGLMGLSLLTVAGLLEPNVQGRGTHQQLGFPQCGFLTIFGKPCPSCGMTTSWSNLMRGQFGKSLSANAAGTWLGSWTLVLSIWSIGSAARGRWLLFNPNQWYFLGLAVSTLLLILIIWVIRFFF